MEEDSLKKIAELREILENRVHNLETELEGMRTLLEFVNNLLLEQSFKRVEVTGIRPSPPTRPTTQPLEKTVQIRARDEEMLATVYKGVDSMRIVPSGDKTFTVSTPPFVPFLRERVLRKIRERDQEAIQSDGKSLDEAFSFEIKRDGDVIREITIRNVKRERERELMSAIHWTLEKMHEKAKR